MLRYHTNSKEVLRDGKHFADCIDDGAARLVADALNERKGMPAADTQDVLPLDGADGPLFIGDRVPPRLHRVRYENDEYACACGARWAVEDGEDHP